MARIKISELVAAAALLGDEIIPIVQGGETVRIAATSVGSSSSLPIAQSDVTDLVTDLAAVSAAIVGKAATNHTHSLSAITDITASVSEVNLLDGLVATTAELNYVSGATSNIQAQINGIGGGPHTHLLVDITDITASVSEVNILDGATVSVAELNILDGATVSVAELNILDGALISTVELNYVDGVTSGIQGQLDGKAASSHTHAQSDITSLVTALAGKAALSHTHVVADLTDITASATEVNILDGALISTVELNYVDGVTSGIQGQLDGKAATSHTHAQSEITGLVTALSGKAASVHTHVIADLTDITASATEVNILDGVIISTTELNYVDGVTSGIQGQLDGKAASSHTHAQSEITGLVTALAGKADSAHTHVITDITGLTVSVGEVNILDGATLTVTELNYVVGVSSGIQAQLNAKAASSHTHTAANVSARPFLAYIYFEAADDNAAEHLRVIPLACSFPSGAANSSGTAGVSATGSTTYNAKKNGSSFCTFVWAGNGTVATVTLTSTTSFNGTSDVLIIDGPATADVTLAKVGILLAGTFT